MSTTTEATINNQDDVTDCCSLGRILVVDDQEMNRDLLQRRLIRKGYDVESVADGEWALQRIAAEAFDLVLLDVMMPGLSGWDVLEAIRQNHSLTELPVVMVTAKTDSEDITKAFAIGANDYVTKPLDMKVALARVRTQVGLKKTSRALHGEIERHEAAQRELDKRATALEASNRELQWRNQSLEELAHMASHDLQEPVRKLVSFAELLKVDLGDGISKDVERDLGFITAAARRMNALNKNLLTLTNIELATADRAIALDECLDRALLAIRSQMDASGAEVQRHPLPVVTGNANLLTDLFQHLIDNAIKFAGDQPPQVQISAEETTEGWIIGVRDNGIGLEERFADRIFKPFQRLHARDQYDGTGIGLAICKRTVQRHGGRIWVESSLGQGAHFQFTLQLAKA